MLCTRLTKCVACDRPIESGDMMRLTSSGKTCHPACFTRAQKAEGVTAPAPVGSQHELSQKLVARLSAKPGSPEYDELVADLICAKMGRVNSHV